MVASSNDLVGNTEATCQLDRALDQQIGADDDPGQTPKRGAKRQEQRARHRCDRLGLGLMQRRRGIPVAPFGQVGRHRVGEQQQEKQPAEQAADAAREAYERQQQARAEQDRAVATERRRLRRERLDQRTDAHDQQDVGDVATDDVADGEARRAGERRIQARDQLRGRGAEADQRETDQERRHLKALRHRHGAAHQELAAREQQDEAGRQQQIGHGQMAVVLYAASRATG